MLYLWCLDTMSSVISIRLYKWNDSFKWNNSFVENIITSYVMYINFNSVSGVLLSRGIHYWLDDGKRNGICGSRGKGGKRFEVSVKVMTLVWWLNIEQYRFVIANAETLMITQKTWLFFMVFHHFLPQPNEFYCYSRFSSIIFHKFVSVLIKVLDFRWYLDIGL